MNQVEQAILFGAAIIVPIAALVYRAVTVPPAEETKQYKPSNYCIMCRRKKLTIKATCTQVAQMEGCTISPYHIHVKCLCCEVEYIQRTTRWYDGIW